MCVELAVEGWPSDYETKFDFMVEGYAFGSDYGTSVGEED